MRLQELFENRLEQARYNAEFDKANSLWEPSAPKMTPTHSVFINGKHWRDFESEGAAMQAGTTVHNKKPRCRVDVMPYKK
jgi:hypothetical protein